MNPLVASLVCIGGILGYFVLGYTTYYQFDKRGNPYDTPLYVMAGVAWPVAIMVLVFGLLPVMGIVWTHNKIQRRLKTKVSVQEVK